MLCIARGRPEQVSKIEGAIHELLWKLLEEMKRQTGPGCVVNTSSNVRNQPIIASPDLALEAMEQMSLNRLYIEGFRVRTK